MVFSSTKFKQYTPTRDMIIKSHVFSHISETKEPLVQQHQTTLTQHTIKHEHPGTKKQKSFDSDTEITEEYTTKFRPGSKDGGNSAVKTKTTIIRKKKPRASKEDKAIVIEEEIEIVKSSLPTIPKKQFMSIEEVKDIIDIEEITPTCIEEVEELPPMIDTSMEETIIDFKQDTKIKGKRQENTIKKNYDIQRTMKRETAEEDVFENLEEEIITKEPLEVTQELDNTRPMGTQQVRGEVTANLDTIHERTQGLEIKPEEIILKKLSKEQSLEKALDKKAVKMKKQKPFPNKGGIEEWVEPEYRRPVLETMPEHIQRAPTTHERDEKLHPQSLPKLVPIKIERIEIKPTKLQVSQPLEIVHFTEVKLKPAPIKKIQQSKTTKFQKIHLRSRKTFIGDYPSKLQLPRTTIFEENPIQNGILSRNTEEALKVLKKKYNKPKLLGKDQKDLEKLDTECEELKKVSSDEIEDKSVYERKSKKPRGEQKAKEKLQAGKGKVPVREEQPEFLKLKKIPEKKPEKFEGITKKPKTVESEEALLKRKKSEGTPRINSEDFEQTELKTPELEQNVPLEKERSEKPEFEEVRKPYKRPTKKKSEQDMEQVSIEKGKPKPQKPVEQPEVKFKIPTSEKPEEKPVEIKLKPWTTEKPEGDSVESKVLKDKKPLEYLRTDNTETETTKPKHKEKVLKDVVVKTSEEFSYDVSEDTQVIAHEISGSEETVEILQPFRPLQAKAEKGIILKDNIEATEVIPGDTFGELSDDILPSEEKASPQTEDVDVAKLTITDVQKHKIGKKQQSIQIGNEGGVTRAKSTTDDLTTSIQELSEDLPIEGLSEKSVSAEKPQPFKTKHEDLMADKISDVTPEKKVAKKKKKKPIAKKDEIEDWVEPEYERPVLEPMPEKIEWKPSKKKKETIPLPESHRKLVPIKIEIKEIKLKKASASKRWESKSTKIPKILLRSRITFIGDYPSELQLPRITIFEENPIQNGTLSRNTEEALKVLKKKHKKPKLPEKELMDLEELDKEHKELEKVPLDEIEDKSVYERKPKKPNEEEKPKEKLQAGKGKVPVEEKQAEFVKLKKISEKKPENFEEITEKPKTIEPTEDILRKKKSEEALRVDSEDFEPTEFKRPELEQYFPPEKERSEKPEFKEVQKPYERPTKKKPEQEMEQVPIEKGKPKSQQPVNQPEVKFKIPASEKPEKQPVEIKLKPWTTEKPEADSAESKVLKDEKPLEKPRTDGTEVENTTPEHGHEHKFRHNISIQQFYDEKSMTKGTFNPVIFMVLYYTLRWNKSAAVFDTSTVLHILFSKQTIQNKMKISLIYSICIYIAIYIRVIGLFIYLHYTCKISQIITYHFVLIFLDTAMENVAEVSNECTICRYLCNFYGKNEILTL